MAKSPIAGGKQFCYRRLHRQRPARRKDLPHGPQRRRQDKSQLSNYPGLADKDFTLDSASVLWGHEAQIGYFPQDVGATIEHGLTVAEWLHRWNPAAHVEKIRGILGQMLFSGEEGDKQTKALPAANRRAWPSAS
jgi:hypothetical protein